MSVLVYNTGINGVVLEFMFKIYECTCIQYWC